MFQTSSSSREWACVTLGMEVGQGQGSTIEPGDRKWYGLTFPHDKTRRDTGDSAKANRRQSGSPTKVKLFFFFLAGSYQEPLYPLGKSGNRIWPGLALEPKMGAWSQAPDRKEFLLLFNSCLSPSLSSFLPSTLSPHHFPSVSPPLCTHSSTTYIHPASQ